VPRRATGLEFVGDTGFRRLGYKNAMDPRDMRALLDPQDDDAPFSLGRLTRPQKAALDRLDALAPKLFLRPADKRLCEKEVQFALGMDKQDKIERLCAIVARAFWRADSYADALAQLFDDAEDAERFLDPLDRFFEIIADGADSPFDKGSPYRGLAKAAMPHKAIDILNRRRLENPAEKDERQAAITDGLAALDLMRRELRSIAEGFHQQGSKPDDARFFFVLRLAEVFVIWAGRAPDFDFEEGEKQRKKKPEWIELSTNALTLCGLGVSGRDGLFKRLGGKGPRGKAYEEFTDYRDLVDSLAQSLGARVETTETIIEWELDPPNIKSDRPTQDLCERLRGELKKRGLAFEQLRKLRDAASKNPIGAEARLGYILRSLPAEFTEQERDAPNEAPMPALAKHFYSRDRDFCGGDLPSSGWLTDLQLAPEPSGYDD
jgi:hypothetical protein